MKDAKNVIAQIAIFTAGFLISLAAILFVGSDKASFGDAQDYIAAANALVTDFTYPNIGSLPFFRPPLYPFFIALIWLIFPASILAVKIAHAVIFGVTGCLIYQIASKTSGNSLAALSAALIFLLNPFFIIQTTDIQTETLHTFLIALGILLSISALKKHNIFSLLIGKAVLLGNVFGFAALCRPSALPVGITLAAAIWFLKFKEIKLVKVTVLFSIIVCSIFLTISPWTIANYFRTSEFILINDASGYAFWAGNHPESLPLYGTVLRNSEEFNRYANYINVDLARERINEWENKYNYSSLFLKQRENLWFQDAVNNINLYPLLTFRLWIYKAWMFWKPYLNPIAYSSKIALFSGVFLITLYLLAMHGAYTVWNDCQGRQILIFIGFLFLSVTIIHSLIISMIRYRVPYVDPYLCVFAGCSLNFIRQSIKLRLNSAVL